MAEPGLILVTRCQRRGVGGLWRQGCGVAASARAGPYEAMAHHDDDRGRCPARARADVVFGDLTRPADVRRHWTRSQRMFFSMSLAPSLPRWPPPQLRRVARAVGDLDALVAISQMTVSRWTRSA